jgi:hypothetical protein
VAQDPGAPRGTVAAGAPRPRQPACKVPLRRRIPWSTVDMAGVAVEVTGGPLRLAGDLDRPDTSRKSAKQTWRDVPQAVSTVVPREVPPQGAS